jgi:hypothetical protein
MEKPKKFRGWTKSEQPPKTWRGLIRGVFLATTDSWLSASR